MEHIERTKKKLVEIIKKIIEEKNGRLNIHQ